MRRTKNVAKKDKPVEPAPPAAQEELKPEQGEDTAQPAGGEAPVTQE